MALKIGISKLHCGYTLFIFYIFNLEITEKFFSCRIPFCLEPHFVVSVRDCTSFLGQSDNVV